MPQYEGLDDLLDALSILNERIKPLVYLLCVGDGDELARLQEQASSRGVGDKARFTGRVPHETVERYYAAMDIMVFPRKPQPVTEVVSPIKPFEAMAMGKPVLGSDVGALAEIIEDGVTGFLFRKGNKNDLARAIERLVDDADLRQEVARQGMDWTRTNRGWDHLSRDLISLYGNLAPNA
jgi:glycosyltransferase involved in cell wall biosynthesis